MGRQWWQRRQWRWRWLASRNSLYFARHFPFKFVLHTVGVRTALCFFLSIFRFRFCLSIFRLCFRHFPGSFLLCFPGQRLLPFFLFSRQLGLRELTSQRATWEITVKSIKMRLGKRRTCVHTYITSKRIELESPGCTGFEENLKCFKTWPTGTF